MTYQEILNNLNAKKYSPIYFLESEESFYIDKIVNQIENNILEESEKAFNQVVLYGRETNFQQVLDQAMQFPMMASHRVVIIKEAQELKNIESLTGYFKNPSTSTILVLAYKNKKFDKRKKKTWDALKKNAAILATKKIYDNQVPAILKQMVADNGLSIGNTEAALMAEHIGADLSRINNEILKLKSVIAEGGSITADHIQENVGINKEYNIFELQNALGRRDFSRCQKIIWHFSQNARSHPIQMHVGALYNYFSKIYLTRKFINSDNATLAKKLRVNPFFIRDYKSSAKNYDLQRLRSVFKGIHELDKRSKGIESRKFNYLGAYQEFLFKVMN